MRREVLFDAVQRIVTDIREAGLVEMLESGMESYRKRTAEGKAEKPNWVSFEVFQRLAIAFSVYTENERRVLRVMEINELTDPRYWAALNMLPASDIWNIQKRVDFAIESLPRLLDLIRNEEIALINKEDQELPDFLRGKDVISVILTGQSETLSSPDRIIKLLNAVSILYKVHARLLGASGDDLAVIGCDSGSEKSFDFLGMAAAIQGLRQTMVDIYDRRLLGRQRQMAANLDLIGQSLPILEEIKQMSEKGTIGAHEAELLKRQVLQGATKFLATGAITEEMTVANLPSARTLMRPEQKLLAAPTEMPMESVRRTDEDPVDEQRENEAGLNGDGVNLTEDEKEIQRLKAEISRLRKAKKSAPARRSAPKSSTHRK